MVTLIFTFLAVVVVGLAINIRENVGKALLYCSALILTIPVAFRGYQVGTDTETYYRIFDRLQQQGEFRYEPVFVMANKVFAWVGLPPEALFAVLAALTLLLIFRFIERHSNDYLISICFFIALAYYFYMFNIVRQGVAIGVTCFAFRYILQRQHLKFIFATLVAVGFHYSAVLFYGAYFLVRRFPLWLISTAWFISLVSLLIYNPLIELMMAVVGQVGEYYLQYFLLDDEEAVLSFRRILLQLIFALGLLLLYKDGRQFVLSKEELAITNITLVGIVASNMLAGLGWLSRLSDYYDIFVILLIPILIYRLVHKNTRPLVVVFLVGFCTLFYFRLLLIGSHGVAPYASWVVGSWW